MRMSGIPEGETWPAPQEEPVRQGVRQGEVFAQTTLWTALGGMLLGSVFMGYTASQGMGPLEEPWATEEVQTLAGVACGAILGGMAGALLGGMAGGLAAALGSTRGDGE